MTPKDERDLKMLVERIFPPPPPSMPRLVAEIKSTWISLAGITYCNPTNEDDLLRLMEQIRKMALKDRALANAFRELISNTDPDTEPV